MLGIIWLVNFCIVVLAHVAWATFYTKIYLEGLLFRDREMAAWVYIFAMWGLFCLIVACHYFRIGE